MYVVIVVFGGFGGCVYVNCYWYLYFWYFYVGVDCGGFCLDNSGFWVDCFFVGGFDWIGNVWVFV